MSSPRLTKFAHQAFCKSSRDVKAVIAVEGINSSRLILPIRLFRYPRGGLSLTHMHLPHWFKL